MVTVRALVIAVVVACVALPGCAGCGQQAQKPVAVHPAPKEAPPPPEMLDSPRHAKEAADLAVAFAKKKYSSKLDFDRPRTEFLGGHAMAVPGANPGKLLAKDAPVGTWRVYLKVLKVTTIADSKAQLAATAAAGGLADASEDTMIGTRVFYVRPDLTVVETQGLPSLATGSAPIDQGGQH